MNDAELERLLKAVYDEDLELAPERHGAWTPACPPLPRFRELVYRPSTQTVEEREHMESCRYCQMTLELCRREEYHPEPAALVAHAIAPTAALPGEVASHLQRDQCELCLAIAREEKALWWRNRLREALAWLAAQGDALTAALAARLRQLPAAAEAQAEAALEVTLDAARRIGRIRFEPAQACLRPQAAMQFRHAPAATRSKLGLGESHEESVGIFLSSAIPGARTIADARQNTLLVEFWEPLPEPLVMLIPQHPAAAPRVGEVSRTEDTARVVFNDLPPGRYLLSIYFPGEPTP